MHGALIYEVARPFSDSLGRLEVGENPDFKRVQSWPRSNLNALISMGSLITTEEAVAQAPEEVEAKKEEPKGQLCSECGEGPFTRMDAHMRKHATKE